MYKWLSNEKKLSNASSVPSSWVWQKTFLTFAELKTLFILLFFHSSIKVGMTQENKLYKQPGSQAFSTLTVLTFWLKWTAEPVYVTILAKELGFGSSLLTVWRLVMIFCSWIGKNHTESVGQIATFLLKGRL